MSYSTDPEKDADRHYGPIYAAQERMEKAREQAEEDFLEACCKCDANALATFAPKAPDYRGSLFNAWPGLMDRAPRPMRYQTLAEVMRDVMDDPPTELMQILLNLVFGDEPEDVTAWRAQKFICSLAVEFAKQNVEVDYGE